MLSLGKFTGILKEEMAIIVVTLKVMGTGDCMKLPSQWLPWAMWQSLATFSCDEWKELYH